MNIDYKNLGWGGNTPNPSPEEEAQQAANDGVFNQISEGFDVGRESLGLDLEGMKQWALDAIDYEKEDPDYVERVTSNYDARVKENQKRAEELSGVGQAVNIATQVGGNLATIPLTGGAGAFVKGASLANKARHLLGGGAALGQSIGGVYHQAAVEGKDVHAGEALAKGFSDLFADRATGGITPSRVLPLKSPMARKAVDFGAQGATASVADQMSQNVVLDNPLMQDTGTAALFGAGIGAGAGAITGKFQMNDGGRESISNMREMQSKSGVKLNPNIQQNVMEVSNANYKVNKDIADANIPDNDLDAVLSSRDQAMQSQFVPYAEAMTYKFAKSRGIDVGHTKASLGAKVQVGIDENGLPIEDYLYNQLGVKQKEVDQALARNKTDLPSKYGRLEAQGQYLTPESKKRQNIEEGNKLLAAYDDMFTDNLRTVASYQAKHPKGSDGYNALNRLSEIISNAQKRAGSRDRKTISKMDVFDQYALDEQKEAIRIARQYGVLKDLHSVEGKGTFQPSLDGSLAKMELQKILAENKNFRKGEADLAGEGIAETGLNKMARSKLGMVSGAGLPVRVVTAGLDKFGGIAKGRRNTKAMASRKEQEDARRAAMAEGFESGRAEEYTPRYAQERVEEAFDSADLGRMADASEDALEASGLPTKPIDDISLDVYDIEGGRVEVPEPSRSSLINERALAAARQAYDEDLQANRLTQSPEDYVDQGANVGDIDVDAYDDPRIRQSKTRVRPRSMNQVGSNQGIARFDPENKGYGRVERMSQEGMHELGDIDSLDVPPARELQPMGDIVTDDKSAAAKAARDAYNNALDNNYNQEAIVGLRKRMEEAADEEIVQSSIDQFAKESPEQRYEMLQRAKDKLAKTRSAYASLGEGKGEERLALSRAGNRLHTFIESVKDMEMTAPKPKGQYRKDAAPKRPEPKQEEVKEEEVKAPSNLRARYDQELSEAEEYAKSPSSFNKRTEAYQALYESKRKQERMKKLAPMLSRKKISDDDLTKLVDEGYLSESDLNADENLSVIVDSVVEANKRYLDDVREDAASKIEGVNESIVESQADKVKQRADAAIKDNLDRLDERFEEDPELSKDDALYKKAVRMIKEKRPLPSVGKWLDTEIANRNKVDAGVKKINRDTIVDRADNFGILLGLPKPRRDEFLLAHRSLPEDAEFTIRDELTLKNRMKVMRDSEIKAAAERARKEGKETEAERLAEDKANLKRLNAQLKLWKGRIANDKYPDAKEQVSSINKSIAALEKTLTPRLKAEQAYQRAMDALESDNKAADAAKEAEKAQAKVDALNKVSEQKEKLFNAFLESSGLNRDSQEAQDFYRANLMFLEDKEFQKKMNKAVSSGSAIRKAELKKVEDETNAILKKATVTELEAFAEAFLNGVANKLSASALGLDAVAKQLDTFMKYQDKIKDEILKRKIRGLNEYKAAYQYAEYMKGKFPDKPETWYNYDVAAAISKAIDGEKSGNTYYAAFNTDMQNAIGWERKKEPSQLPLRGRVQSLLKGEEYMTYEEFKKARGIKTESPKATIKKANKKKASEGK